MKKYDKDSNSLLYSYYTLTHASTSHNNAPSPSNARSSKKNEAESGDETDRSVELDNEVTESFIMDEINENTEACSLNSSRENLLDGDCRQVIGRESRPGTRPNSRPSSARRGSMNNAELPVDERIKALEEGLKEADMEREVVLSCLGKEYLERVTMQNYLQEICTKSGYNYDEIVANMDVQSGAENILENMIEMRTKALLKNRNKNINSNQKPQDNENKWAKKNNDETVVTIDQEMSEKENVNVLNSITEDKLRDIIAKVIQAEQERVNIHTHGDIQRDENSHTEATKQPVVSHMSSPGENNLDKKQAMGSSRIKDVPQTDKSSSIVRTGQSDASNANSKRTIDSTQMYPEKNAAICRKEKTTSLCEGSEQSNDMKGFDIKHKQNLLHLENMPSLSAKEQGNDGLSFLQSLERKSSNSAEQSLDSIDEGIYLLKSFLKDLLNSKQRSPGRIINLKEQNVDKTSGSGRVASENNTAKVKPRRKLSLNDPANPHNKPDLKPQRRRSYAEGMNNIKPSFESRLFRATVSSQNKAKDKLQRKDDSDSESSKKIMGSTSTPRMTRSSTDIRNRSRRSSNASTEDDSSMDGDDDLKSVASQISGNKHSFEYVYEIEQDITNREYSKLVNVLDMLQNQKRKWEDEVRSLKEKIDELNASKSDLNHDNSVLRKSLEAANHAIKEINAKVQELKLTIVPLRDENTKLREQNQSLKSKLDLLRKDKATLLQEFQELKKMKLKYEDKLQLVIDLYQNGRINLATDRNNNHPNETAESFAKDGLKSLLDIHSEKTKEQLQPKSRSKPIRDQDKSKRHSFHGFEKIDELAGNSEELVAENEKIQAENSNLKKELKELKEKFSAEKEEDAMTEAEILNRRRSWRMQREESKHRIIREILKTESSQAKYGRAYSSCGDLTLADNAEYSSRSVWGGKKEKERHKEPVRDNNADKDVSNEGRNKEKAIDRFLRMKAVKNTNSPSEEKVVDETDYFPFVNGYADTTGAVNWESWKLESEKLEKRLTACKFDDKNSGSKRDGEKGSRKQLHAERLEKNKKILKDLDSYRDDSNDGRTESVSRDVESDDEEDVSRPSTQWPIVKKKIQAIYGQPVEFSDGGNDDDEEDESWIPNTTKKETTEYGSSRKPDVSRNSAFTQTTGKYDMATEELKSKKEVREVQSRDVQRMSVQKMLAKHIMEVVEGEVRSEATDTHKMEQMNGDRLERETVPTELEREQSEWQRKSSEGEHDFEKYTELTKQRKAQNNNPRSQNNKPRSQNNKPRSQSESDEGGKQDMKKANVKKIHSMELTSGKSTKEIRQKMPNGHIDSGDASPWIKIPIYLKNGEEKSPSKEGKKKEKQPSTKGSHVKVEKNKTVEETLTKVESAFASAKSAGKKLFKKQTKSKSGKDEGKFVRKASGTVMYLDEIADSDSDDNSFERPTTIPRRSRSFRRPRPKSDYWSSEQDSRAERLSSEQGSSFQRVQSLRLPKKSKDDMFAVDISFESNSANTSEFSSSSYQHSDSYAALKQSHFPEHQHSVSCNHVQDRRRIQSETGLSRMRSEKRPKSPGGFSCEMCRELTKKKNAQEKYCWEKYFPIGETTIQLNTVSIREDYV